VPVEKQQAFKKMSIKSAKKCSQKLGKNQQRNQQKISKNPQKLARIGKNLEEIVL
jgi:hypothetical protein